MFKTNILDRIPLQHQKIRFSYWYFGDSILFRIYHFVLRIYCHVQWKSRSWLVYLLLALPIVICSSASADNIRPAYLDLEETGPGTFRVAWKVPANQNLPARFAPAFPEHFQMTSAKKRVSLPNSVIEKWNMVSDTGTLAGATIGINGIEETATDALLRVQLADGTLFREILRPTKHSTTVPAALSEKGEKENILKTVFNSIDHWRYGILLFAAWLLSLTPAARRRGIVLCSTALIVGSLSGQALSMPSVQKKLFPEKMLSDTGAKRILSGLLLNTYRAIMLGEDEQAYDVLARSVDGEFLSRIYLENREALGTGSSDQAMSIVDRLDIKNIDSMKRLKDGSISITASWDVYGSVSHWNHIHFRCNAYKAELTIVPVDNYWKLTHLQLLDEERVI